MPPSGSGAVTASALNISITGVSINSPPVVNFTVTDQAGVGVANLAATDLRFNIAKLVPDPSGGPSVWQNYINKASSGAVQGSQERSSAGYAFGSLVNNGSGSYTYTFATDIKDPAANPCPAPCTDANGKALDLSYQPGLTHRVTIQQANGAYAKASGVYDFVPSGGGVVTRRDVVATATCNNCHNELSVHTTRVDTRLCVTCHNPGSWVAGTPNTPVDFKVMIHRIHYNVNNDKTILLPSVLAGTPYKIGTKDYSGIVFTQDVRNCTTCHDGTPGASNATAQGDNWKTQPSMEACGACHDDVYFGAAPDPAKPYQTIAHPGGVMSNNSFCSTCHTAGKFADNKDIVVAHSFPSRFKAAAAKFKYNILSVTPTAAGAIPVVTFSVTDPTNGNQPYDIKADQPFLGFAPGGPSRLSISIGWNTADFGNAGSGQSYGQPVSISLLNNAAVAAGATAGTYTVTSTAPVPAGQTGTLRVLMEGHPAGDVTTAGTFTDRLPVKSVFKDYAISGSATARRVVVDAAKCDACHSVLSAHGGNRNEEPGVCVVCHNPDATDRAQRILGAAAGEESIDFKTMIHAIHAGQADKGGYRTTGITIYNYAGIPVDFSTLKFPGKVNDCSNCHAGTSYQLTGTWAAPTANGILGSTVSTAGDPASPSDNLRNSPTAAVCLSCHDGASTRSHVEGGFPNGRLSLTQADIAAAPVEACTFCHGPGRVFDVKTVHGVK